MNVLLVSSLSGDTPRKPKVWQQASDKLKITICGVQWLYMLFATKLACVTVADPEAGEVEGRYSRVYEEKMNPFTDFRSREKEARRQQMHVLDRIMFEFGHFISGSQ